VDGSALDYSVQKRKMCQIFLCFGIPIQLCTGFLTQWFRETFHEMRFHCFAKQEVVVHLFCCFASREKRVSRNSKTVISFRETTNIIFPTLPSQHHFLFVDLSLLQSGQSEFPTLVLLLHLPPPPISPSPAILSVRQAYWNFVIGA
jgi:hypothetical protein